MDRAPGKEKRPQRPPAQLRDLGTEDKDAIGVLLQEKKRGTLAKKSRR